MCAVSVVQTPYEQHRDYVLSVLGRRCGWLDQADREAIFHDAYALLLEKQRDGDLDLETMHPHQVRAYLVQTSLYKSLDEGKRAERKRAVPMGDDAFASPDASAPMDEMLATSLEGARVREIIDELPERRQAIVKLRFFLDRAPSEIQELLGIRERVYRRELERAMRHIAERYELVRDGNFCDSRRSLVMAYVSGVAGPNRAREAQAHLDTCPACRHWAVQLRDAARQVAGALPLPVLADREGLLTHAVNGFVAVKGQLLDVATNVKQHAAMGVARVDATTAGYSTVARPGTVAAALAGCLALGGGATYCAVEGLPDPVRSLVTHERPARAQRPERKPKPKQVKRQAAAQPAPTTTVAAKPKQVSKPKPQTRSTSTPAPKPTPVQKEFGLDGSGSTASPAATPQAPPPTPAPGPPGEFDP
jgi:RNA polymerase sigma factor (sigma-70 family)